MYKYNLEHIYIYIYIPTQTYICLYAHACVCLIVSTYLPSPDSVKYLADFTDFRISSKMN